MKDSDHRLIGNRFFYVDSGTVFRVTWYDDAGGELGTRNSLHLGDNDVRAITDCAGCWPDAVVGGSMDGGLFRSGTAGSQARDSAARSF